MSTLPEARLINDACEPTQNAYVESFNGKFRDKCLNEPWFDSLHQARPEIARWRRDYNEVRPHRAVGRTAGTGSRPSGARSG